jgi:carboxyl-terminal processing protease
MRAELTIVLVALITAPKIAWCRPQGRSTSPAQVVDQVWDIVNQKFIDPSYNHHDWGQMRRHLLSERYASTAQAYAAIRSMLQLLGEPQTRFLEPAQFASTVQEFSGEVGGIGLADAWVDVDPNTGEFEILHLIVNSPAFKAGVLPGDVIQAVDGIPIKDLSRDEAIARVRGKAGTVVRLKVERGGKLFDVDVTREALMSHTVRAVVASNHDKTFGYITLAQFGGDSVKEMRDAIVDLLHNGVQGFVLDLRNNPGGFVPASRDIASMFLGNKQLIYYSFERTGTPKELRTAVSPITNKPLVVIVNRATASAAEMLAGALKDNHRATLVGTNTFGQGLIHSVQPLQDGSGLVIAVARFETPAGTDVEHGGISPDYVVQSAETDLARNTPATDPQYQEAVRILLQDIPRLRSPKG